MLLLTISSWAAAEKDLSAIKSPALEKSQAELVSALRSLKLHITGDTPLSDPEIATHKLTIDTNKEVFASSSEIIAASFDLVETYDDVIGPLWVSDSPVKSINRKDVSDSDIHWVVYTVMQNIIDTTYTEENIVRHKDRFDGFKFQSSANFPGAVDAPADPEQPYTVKISGTFLKTFGRDTMYWIKPARKPTGAYLAPGSIATITVPQLLVGKGYQVRVGAHTWDLTRRPRILRLDRSSLTYDINSTQVSVASPLGGGIYIDVPIEADAGIVEIQIQNAVRSPYFSAKPFHKTTLEEWQNTERHHPAPWADFQSENYMMNLPTSWIQKLDDPATLMDDWDKATEATNALMGFDPVRGKETMYNQIDLQMPYGFHATGYPAVNSSYNPNKDYGGLSNHHLIKGPQYAPYVEFHELGHGYLFPKFPGEAESNVNLLHVAVWNQKFGYSLDEAFEKSMNYKAPYRTLDTTSVAWMMSKNFRDNKPMVTKEKQYQIKGHAKYVDMVRMFGWDVLGNYWNAQMTDEENGIPEDITRNTDTILLKLSIAAGIDVRPLFHFWGIHPENPHSLDRTFLANSLSPSMEIYTTLRKYQSFIPADNAAYQTFALAWWKGKQPRSKGYMTEQWHAEIWDTYDEAYATLIRNNVENIISQYFPDGPPDTGGVGDTDAPKPNPMTFSSPPTMTGEKSISMTATEAADPSWTQYYFACTAGGGHDSGWQASRTYEDSGLTAATLYTYTVTARDYSSAQNTTAPSQPASVKTKSKDITTPTPNPITWEIAPRKTSPSTIYMVATTASDASGVEYNFTCTAGGGHDSGWQDDTSFTDSGLTAGTQYTYTITARDKSPQHNSTKTSAESSATTKAATSNPYLVTSKPESAEGEDIVVHFQTADSTAYAWVALYLPSTPSANYDKFQWMYVDGTEEGSTGISEGTLTFNGLSPGSYQARIHFDEEGTLEYSIDFTVK